jgi:putative ABC transport system substrate-binding protein
LGYLSGGSPEASEYSLDILTASLHELGWRAGETLDIDVRFAHGDSSRFPELAKGLVALRPDVIAATGASETKALQRATQDIPVVFMQVADPIAAGVVESIARPGKNIIGLAQGPQILWGKRLELMTELLARPPRRLAWLGNPGNVGSPSGWTDAQDAAARIGAELLRIEVSEAAQLDEAFKAVNAADALMVQWDFLFAVERYRIAGLAARARVPAIYENRTQVLAGGLISYGGDLRENYRQGAAYVDRILRGARPSDLPVIQASRFELVLNLGAAKVLGLTVPLTILARADEVIE